MQDARVDRKWLIHWCCAMIHRKSNFLHSALFLISSDHWMNIKHICGNTCVVLIDHWVNHEANMWLPACWHTHWNISIVYQKLMDELVNVLGSYSSRYFPQWILLAKMLAFHAIASISNIQLCTHACSVGNMIESCNQIILTLMASISPHWYSYTSMRFALCSMLTPSLPWIDTYIPHMR